VRIPNEEWCDVASSSFYVRAACLLSLTLAVGLLLPRATCAYDPRQGHKQLAEAAIEGFNLCITADVDHVYSLPVFEIGKYAATIVEADVAEDEKNLLRRALNWHFYSTSGPQIHFLTDRSLDRVFSGIEDKLKADGIAPSGAYKLVGRAMHFLEDVTVPAHVVPVYHGPGFPRSIKDPVDTYRVQGLVPGQILAREVAGALPGKCKELAAAPGPGAPQFAPAGPLRSILDLTAEETRTHRLAGALCESGGLRLKWRRFWTFPASEKFFGRYADDTPVFGAPGVIRGSHGSSCKLTWVEYDAFVLAGHKQAVLADIRALFYVSRMLYGSPIEDD
jgi:hypothetical protein